MAIFRRCLSSMSSSGRISSSSDVYDMVIVGGGIVGSALSCAVGHTPSLSNKRILLVESSSTPPVETTPTQPFSKRVSSLSQGSVNLFKRLNVWSDIEAVRCKPFKSIYVWDACSNASISFSSRDSMGFDIPIGSIVSHDSHVTDEPYDGDDVMGYIVENDVILKALHDRVSVADNVTVKRGTHVHDVNTEQGHPNPWVRVTLGDGEEVTTRLLIGADGVKSQVRQLTGLQTVQWNYNQSAVVASLELEQGFTENLVAWQRFLPSGPIALLPLSDSHSSLVWSTSTEHAKNLLQMNEGDFIDSINTALFSDHLANPVVDKANEIVKSVFQSISPESVTPRQIPPSVTSADMSSRGMFPLSTCYVPNYVKPRIALIGDSAHHIHPLAGLGVNLGLGDVACLYQLLVTANNIGEEWGSLPRLHEYETTRQRQNLPVMGVIESIQRLFSTSFVPAALIRSVGLQVTGSLQPLKAFIYNRAQNT